MIVIADSEVFYLSESSSGLSLSKYFDFTAPLSNFFSFQILGTFTRTLAFGINSDDSNYGWLIEFNSVGDIIALKSISIAFSDVYWAVESKKVDEVYFYANDGTPLIITFDFSLYKYSQKRATSTKTRTKYIYGSKSVTFGMYDTALKESYIFITDYYSEINNRLSDCQIDSYGTITSLASPTSKTIPSSTSYSISISTTTLTTPAVSSLSFTASDYSFSSILQCTTFMMTPYFQKSDSSTTLTYSSYSNIIVGGIFWKNSGSDPLSVTAVNSRGNKLSWIQFNSVTGKLEGHAPYPNSIYDIFLKVSPYNAEYSYKLTLTIHPCSDGGCLKWSNSKICYKCKDGYKMDDSSHTWKGQLGVTSATNAGTYLVISTTATAVLTMLSQKLSPRSSVRSIFIIFEHYQLLLTLLLLHTRLSKKVFEFLQSFLLFVPNLNALTRILSIDVSFSLGSKFTKQPNTRLVSLGFDYLSTFADYLHLIIFLGLIIFTHFIMFIIFKMVALEIDVSRYESRLPTEKDYRPNFVVKALSVVWRFFTFNFYITLFAEAYLFGLICCLNEIIRFDGQSNLDYFSIVLSYLGVFVFALLFILITAFVFKTDASKHLKGKVQFIFNGLKTSSKSKCAFTVVFLVRRTCLAFALMFISDRYFQFGIYIVTNCIHSWYLVQVFPFELVSDNLIYILNDFCIIVLSMMYSILMANGDTTSMSVETFEKYWETIWFIVIATNSTIWLIMLGSIYWSFAQWILSLIQEAKTKSSKDKFDDLSSNQQNNINENSEINYETEIPKWSINPENNSSVFINKGHAKLKEDERFEFVDIRDKIQQTTINNYEMGEFRLRKKWNELEEEEKNRKKNFIDIIE
jgi:hypothetical protein